VALPLLGLYELSIYIAGYVSGRRKQKLGMTEE
jgi:Sec-independent protein secretion pathway component TatC